MAVRVPDQITMTSTLDARKRLQEAERHIAERRGFIVAQSAGSQNYKEAVATRPVISLFFCASWRRRSVQCSMTAE